MEEIILYFKVLGIPKPKQSFKFSKTGATYQDAKVLGAEQSFIAQILPQIPKDFTPFDEAIQMDCIYIFPFNSTTKKRDIEEGKIFYKITKPDITDNLNKGVVDAMNGIVYVDDARIAKFSSEKLYGNIPRVEVKITTLRSFTPEKAKNKRGVTVLDLDNIDNIQKT